MSTSSWMWSLTREVCQLLFLEPLEHCLQFKWRKCRFATSSRTRSLVQQILFSQILLTASLDIESQHQSRLGWLLFEGFLCLLPMVLTSPPLSAFRDTGNKQTTRIVIKWSWNFVDFSANNVSGCFSLANLESIVNVGGRKARSFHHCLTSTDCHQDTDRKWPSWRTVFSWIICCFTQGVIRWTYFAGNGAEYAQLLTCVYWYGV